MQKHSRLLIEELVKDDSLHITVLHPHKENVFNDPRLQEISVAPIDTQKNYLLECYKYSGRIGAILDKLDVDIIYSQGLSVWAGIDRFKHKLIVNPHGLEPYQAIGFKNRLLAIPFKWVFGYIFNKASMVISLGGKLTDILRKHISNPGKICTAPNGVLVPLHTAAPSGNKGRVNVLFLARFAANKGINILFEAIDQLHASGELDGFEFVLGGKGPLYEYYRQKNQYEQVRLLGFVADEEIGNLYQQAHVFVLPTLFEGMPTVVLEAMSYRLPIIVTDVGATAELVDDTNGFLINANAVQQLTGALRAFRDLDAETRRKMGEASRTKVEQRFTWKAVADVHKTLFHQLLNK